MRQITAANENINNLMVGADLCFHNDLWLPGLCLIFITMDVFASLGRSNPAAASSRADFVCWAEEFLLPGSNLGCSGLDLYASRCGLLHRQAPSSQLFEEGKVKQIWYAWGASTVEELQIAADRSKRAGQVIVVHVDQLREALCRAASRFAAMLDRDSERAAQILDRAERGAFAGADGDSIRRLAGLEV